MERRKAAVIKKMKRVTILLVWWVKYPMKLSYICIIISACVRLVTSPSRTRQWQMASMYLELIFRTSYRIFLDSTPLLNRSPSEDNFLAYCRDDTHILGRQIFHRDMSFFDKGFCLTPPLCIRHLHQEINQRYYRCI